MHRASSCSGASVATIPLIKCFCVERISRKLKAKISLQTASFHQVVWEPLDQHIAPKSTKSSCSSNTRLYPMYRNQQSHHFTERPELLATTLREADHDKKYKPHDLPPGGSYNCPRGSLGLGAGGSQAAPVFCSLRSSEKGPGVFPERSAGEGKLGCKRPRGEMSSRGEADDNRSGKTGENRVKRFV
jgi:hypothetical protein